MSKVLSQSQVNNEVDSPYVRARAAWDERIGSARVQAYNWRMVAFFSLILLALSVGGNIYLGAKEKVIPYVVELKPNGEATAIQTAKSLSADASENAVKFFISRFIMLAREIPSDAVLFKRNMTKVFQLVTGQGKAILSEGYAQESPAKEFERKNRVVKIASVLQTSMGIYQVDWDEAEYDKSGQKIAEYSMRGTFKIQFLSPSTDAHMEENPLGIFIDFFSWTKLGV